MKLISKSVAVCLLLAFGTLSVCPPDVLAQVLSPSSAQNFVETGLKPVSTGLASPILSGIKIYPQEPFRFDFLISDYNSPQPPLYTKRGSHQLSEDNPPSFSKEGVRGSYVQEEYLKLIKYFMASLTVPEGDLWVNLSPYEPDRIIPEALGQTEMGRDLLAQDYILKQLTASLMNPEGETGKKFWDKVYERLYTTVETHRNASLQNDGNDMQDAIESFNKVWIIPDQVEIYQNGDVAYIVDAKLKVMLESDYVAQQKSVSLRGAEGDEAISEIASQKTLAMTEEIKQVIRSIIIPIIEEEVNHGAAFANLRQIFHSMILAKWYEQHFKNSVLGQSYVDHNTTEGIKLPVIARSPQDDEAISENNKIASQKTLAMTIEGIYEQYLQAFKSGTSDLIKEEYDPVTQGVVTRKYFVGGVKFNRAELKMVDQIEGGINMAQLSVQLIPEVLNWKKSIVILGFLLGATTLNAQNLNERIDSLDRQLSPTTDSIPMIQRSLPDSLWASDSFLLQLQATRSELIKKDSVIYQEVSKFLDMYLNNEFGHLDGLYKFISMQNLIIAVADDRNISFGGEFVSRNFGVRFHIWQSREDLDVLKMIYAHRNADQYLREAIELKFAESIIDSDTPPGVSKQEMIKFFMDFGAIQRGIEEGGRGLETVAKVLVIDMNERHAEPISTRLSNVADLTAQQLYYVINYGHEEMVVNSTFKGLLDFFLLKLVQEKKSFLKFLEQNDYHFFVDFIEMVMEFNQLDRLLEKFSPAERKSFYEQIIHNVEDQQDKNLDKTVAVSEIIRRSRDNTQMLRVFTQTMLVKYEQADTIHSVENAVRFGMLLNIVYQIKKGDAEFLGGFPKLKLVAGKYPINVKTDRLSKDLLFDQQGVNRQWHFFYNDDDGVESFKTFQAQYKNDSKWKITDHKTFIKITSDVYQGRQIEIYANKPAEKDGINDIKKATENIEFAVLVHRGHSFHTLKTISNISGTEVFVFLGSCGGFRNIGETLAKSSIAHILSTKGTGKRAINDPFLKLINEMMLEKGMIVWDDVWVQAEVKLGSITGFKNYINPRKNLPAVFIYQYHVYVRQLKPANEAMLNISKVSMALIMIWLVGLQLSRLSAQTDTLPTVASEIYQLILTEVRQNARFDIASQLAQVIGQNLITGIGGNHFSPLPQKYLISGLREYIQKNPKQKIIIGLETGSNLDEEMNEYIRTPLGVSGETPGVLLPGGVEILSALRLLVHHGADIYVFGFDDRERNPFTGFRQDTLMAGIVDEHIRAFPDAKFLLFGGQRHIQKSPRLSRDAHSPSLFYLLDQTHGSRGVYSAAVYDGSADINKYYNNIVLPDVPNLFLEAVLSDSKLASQEFMISDLNPSIFKTIRINSPFSLDRTKPFDWTDTQVMTSGTFRQELNGVIYGKSSNQAMLSKLFFGTVIALLSILNSEETSAQSPIDTSYQIKAGSEWEDLYSSIFQIELRKGYYGHNSYADSLRNEVYALRQKELDLIFEDGFAEGIDIEVELQEVHRNIYALENSWGAVQKLPDENPFFRKLQYWRNYEQALMIKKDQDFYKQMFDFLDSQKNDTLSLEYIHQFLIMKNKNLNVDNTMFYVFRGRHIRKIGDYLEDYRLKTKFDLDWLRKIYNADFYVPKSRHYGKMITPILESKFILDMNNASFENITKKDVLKLIIDLKIFEIGENVENVFGWPNMSLDLINDLNQRHEEPVTTRFSNIDFLDARTLYVVMNYGKEEMVVAGNFKGLLDLFLKKLAQEKKTLLGFLEENDYGLFVDFIEMVMEFNQLDRVMAQIPLSQRENVYKKIVAHVGFEKDPDLQKTVALVEIINRKYQDEEIMKGFVGGLQTLYRQAQQDTSYEDMVRYGMLLSFIHQLKKDDVVFAKKFPQVKSMALKFPFNNSLGSLGADVLFDADGVNRQQHYFYNDADGLESFAHFQSFYKDGNQWTITDQGSYIVIKSRTIKGRAIEMYANKPDSENGISDMEDATRGFSIPIVVHRGHSFHTRKTIEKISSSAVVVFLGSCGGFRNMGETLDRAPNAHILSTRGVGTRAVNDVLLKEMNAEILRSGMLSWIVVWTNAGQKLGDNDQFSKYVEPSKNRSVRFIHQNRFYLKLLKGDEAMMSKPAIIAGFLALMWLALLKPSRLDAQTDTLALQTFRQLNGKFEFLLDRTSMQTLDLDSLKYSAEQGNFNALKELRQRAFDQNDSIAMQTLRALDISRLMNVFLLLAQDNRKSPWEVDDPLDEYLNEIRFLVRAGHHQMMDMMIEHILKGEIKALPLMVILSDENQDRREFLAKTNFSEEFLTQLSSDDMVEFADAFALLEQFVDLGNPHTKTLLMDLVKQGHLGAFYALSGLANQGDQQALEFFDFRAGRDSRIKYVLSKHFGFDAKDGRTNDYRYSEAEALMKDAVSSDTLLNIQKFNLLFQYGLYVQKVSNSEVDQLYDQYTGKQIFLERPEHADSLKRIWKDKYIFEATRALLRKGHQININSRVPFGGLWTSSVASDPDTLQFQSGFLNDPFASHALLYSHELAHFLARASGHYLGKSYNHFSPDHLLLALMDERNTVANQVRTGEIWHDIGLSSLGDVYYLSGISDENFLNRIRNERLDSLKNYFNSPEFYEEYVTKRMQPILWGPSVRTPLIIAEVLTKHARLPSIANYTYAFAYMAACNANLERAAYLIAIDVAEKKKISLEDAFKDPDFQKKFERFLKLYSQKLTRHPNLPLYKTATRLIHKINRQDRAMMNSMDFEKGGIDLNNLNMKTQGEVVPLTIPQDAGSFPPILRLEPRILHVGEINLGVFLGMNDPKEDPAEPNSSEKLLAIKEDV